MSPQDRAYVVTYRMIDEYSEYSEAEIRSVHTTLNAANQAAKELRDSEIEEYGLDEDDDDADADHENTTAADSGASGLFSWDYEDTEGQFDGRMSIEIRVVERPLVASRTHRSHRHDLITTTIPEGQPLLRGAKFFFAGETRTVDTASARAAIVLYDGRIVEKPDEADYAVIGQNAGQDALDGLNLSGVEKIDEGFLFILLRQGVPADKSLRRDRPKEANTNDGLSNRETDITSTAIAGKDQELISEPPKKRARAR